MSGMMKNCPMMKGMSGQMQGEMQGGMMGMMMKRMTSGPVRQSVMHIYLLPTAQDALSLNEDQVARLTEMKQQFVEQRTAIQERLMAKEEQLKETLRADQPDLEQAEALLAERARLEADAKLGAVEAAAGMKDALSGEQREELGTLKPMQMHRAMMANMSMMDMMQMMKAMPMRQGGMMNGGGMMKSGEGTTPMDDEMQNRDDSK